MRLKNKICMITNVSNDLGFYIAEAFVKEQAKIILCDSTLKKANEIKEKLMQLYPESEIQATNFNVTNTKEINDAVKKIISIYGKIDCLINNSIIIPNGGILSSSESEYIKNMDNDVNSIYYITKSVVEYMKSSGGSIINSACVIELNNDKNEISASLGTETINVITKKLANEIGEYNIRVNSVNIGAILFDKLNETKFKENLIYLKTKNALKRYGYPKEITGLYIYLASDESTFVTGTTIKIDGGLTIKK